MRWTASMPATIALPTAAFVSPRWWAQRAAMTAPHAALNAQRCAGYVQMRLHAIAHSSSKPVSFVRKYAIGVNSNVTRMIWSIANAALKHAAIAQRLAAL